MTLSDPARAIQYVPMRVGFFWNRGRPRPPKAILRYCDPAVTAAQAGSYRK